MRVKLFFIVILISSFAGMRAQNDPTLAGMILMYTNKAEKELKNQEKVMLLQSTGHIWTKEEVEATTDLQREFNNYLDSFRSIVSYAAQIYGFYHEIGQLVDNMGGLVAQLDAHPANGLAVALSVKRNKIYRELIMNSIEIVNDIRTVCLSGQPKEQREQNPSSLGLCRVASEEGEANKMTEKERVEIVFGIRPKLKKMNKQLKRLTRAVKYTTMGDVWMEIDEGSRPAKANKAEIAAAAKRRWKQVGKNVKP